MLYLDGEKMEPELNYLRHYTSLHEQSNMIYAKISTYLEEDQRLK